MNWKGAGSAKKNSFVTSNTTKPLSLKHPSSTVMCSRSPQPIANKAFQAFFRRVRAGQTPGYPRFKGHNRFHSIGFKEYGKRLQTDGRRLKVFGIGVSRYAWHRPLEGDIKTLRIMQQTPDAGMPVHLRCT